MEENIFLLVLRELKIKPHICYECGEELIYLGGYRKYKCPNDHHPDNYSVNNTLSIFKREDKKWR